MEAWHWKTGEVVHGKLSNSLLLRFDEAKTNALQSDGTWLFAGRDEIKYLNDTYQIQLPENEEDYDTINGLILYYLEDFPDVGQKVVVDQYEIEILEVSEQMVKKVKVSDL